MTQHKPPAKAKKVRLPSDRVLYLWWYVPDGYTSSGKVKPFKPSAGELRRSQQLEKEYLLWLRTRG